MEKSTLEAASKMYCAWTVSAECALLAFHLVIFFWFMHARTMIIDELFIRLVVTAGVIYYLNILTGHILPVCQFRTVLCAELTLETTSSDFTLADSLSVSTGARRS